MADSSYNQFRQDLLHVDEITQTGLIVIRTDIAWAGAVKAVEGNILMLLPRVLLAGGNAANPSVSASDANSRAFIRFNRQDAPGIPFSLIANSLDQQFYVGIFKKIFIDVVGNAPANSALYFVTGIGIGVSAGSASGGCSGSGGGYST
jgi:hypothetical protein